MRPLFRTRWHFLSLAIGLCLLLPGTLASAQGLLYSLPEDGTGVRYEGTYKQLVKRPNAVEGDTTVTGTQRLRIASVGKEDAMFRGQTEPCRWIEFKVQTGRPKEGDIDAGPGSVRIFKVLIPESAIRGTITEPIGGNREIYVSFLPIVKGFRKIGDEEAQPIEPAVFQVRPLLTQLQHYRNLMPEGSPEELQVTGGTFSSQLFKGSAVSESQSQRSTNSAELYRSDAVPFGLVKWTAKTITEEKPTTATRAEFVVTNEITEEMAASEILSGVESELITP
jgi:hypothetical protein